jgi:thiol-disulfide isomerase/thioredoxin
VTRDLLIRRAATAATLLCVVAVAGYLLLIFRPEWRRVLGLGTGDLGYAAGDQVDLPDRVYRSSPLTLVVFSRADCAACQGAKPALKEVIDALWPKPDVRVKVVATHAEAPAERQFARDLGLDDSDVIKISHDDLRVARVPTTLLVDRGGRVLYSVEGAPAPADREEILRIATSSTAAR